jgi:hypothetical protein
MTTEQIQEKLSEIRNEIYFLDGLRDTSDDVNIHCIEDQIDALNKQKSDLQLLLDLSFDELIGL